MNSVTDLVGMILKPDWYPDETIRSHPQYSEWVKHPEIVDAVVQRWQFLKNKSVLSNMEKGSKPVCRTEISKRSGNITVFYQMPDNFGWTGWSSDVPENSVLSPKSTMWLDLKEHTRLNSPEWKESTEVCEKCCCERLPKEMI